MWAYWFEENRESFKQLSRLVDRRQLLLEEGQSDSDECGSPFSTSFPNRAKKDWKKLSEPYLKRKYEDANDIIDDSSVEEEAGPRPIMADGKADPEEEMIKHLRQKNRDIGDDGSSSAESSVGSERASNSFSSQSWEREAHKVDEIVSAKLKEGYNQIAS